MSNVVFVEVPASGHVNPTLPLVRELARRGENVIYCYSEEFQPQVERAGATFRAYPAGVLTSADIARATQTGDLTRVPGLILRATEQLVPVLLEELPGSNRTRLWPIRMRSGGHIAPRMLNLPTAALMTTFMLSRAQYKRLSPREWISLRDWRPEPGTIMHATTVRL
jgi:hypothetical protein